MTRPVVHLIAHFHWDREWYLPLGGFRARLAPAMTAVLEALAVGPELSGFLLDGQTVLIEDYLAIHPGRRGLVAAMVRSGRLEAGPWYVLADEQVPAGESLLRNLALGRRDVEALTGTLSGEGAPVPVGLPVLYSPDAFGHPPVLPAIAAEFGLELVLLWRGLDPAKVGGKDLCRWRAPDGTAVSVLLLPRDGYELGSALLVPDERLAEAWARVRREILPRATLGAVPLFVGADHHAPHPDLPGLARRLAAVDPSVEFRCSSLTAWAGAARAAPPGEAAEVRGELRDTPGLPWALQGVHGTRAGLKRRHGAVELLLVRHAEPLAALTGDPGAGAILERAWREVIQSQFHDTLSGCTADAVARAAAVRLGDAEAAVREVVRTALDRLAGHDPDRMRERVSAGSRLVVWNPAALPVGGVMVAEATFFRRDIPVGPPAPGGQRATRMAKGWRPFVLTAPLADGTRVEVVPQVLSVAPGLERRDAPRHYPDQDAVDVVKFAFPLPEPLPGLGLRIFEVADARRQPLEIFTAAAGRQLWNGRVSALVERGGTIALAAGGEVMGRLLALESERDEGDTYSFCPAPGGAAPARARAGHPRVTAPGPLLSELEWDLRLRPPVGARKAGGGNVDATIALRLVGDAPVLRGTLHLDHQARDHRLRLRLPTGLRGGGTLLRAGAQFGWIERPVRRPGGAGGRGRGAEQPVATAPAHRWVAAARKGRGLALFAPGFFEYEWTPDGDLLFTVLRAVGELSRSDLATRPGHAGWPIETPGAQCPGRDTVIFGLAPVTAEDLGSPERLERMWERTFLPPEPRWLRDYAPAHPAHTSPDPQPEGVRLEGDSLVFSACVPAGSGPGLVFRCWNAAERPADGAWHLPWPVQSAARVRADGTVLAPLAVTAEGRTVAFTAGARAMVSVLVAPGGAAP